MWTDERIRLVAAQWRWIPRGAEVARSEQVTVYARNGKSFVDSAAGEDLAALVEQACWLGRELDTGKLVWSLIDGSWPPALAELLAARGATVIEERELCTHLLATSLDLAAPAAVEVSLVDDPALLPDFYAGHVAAFDAPYPSEATVEAETRMILADRADPQAQTIFRYRARLDGETVGTAGMLLEDGVAKLWGGGVRPEHRGKGVYRALLSTRLDEARRRGCELALVKAKTTTSAPILLGLGFSAHGRERLFELPLG